MQYWIFPFLGFVVYIWNPKNIFGDNLDYGNTLWNNVLVFFPKTQGSHTRSINPAFNVGFNPLHSSSVLGKSIQKNFHGSLCGFLGAFFGHSPKIKTPENQRFSNYEIQKNVFYSPKLSLKSLSINSFPIFAREKILSSIPTTDFQIQKLNEFYLYFLQKKIVSDIRNQFIFEQEILNKAAEKRKNRFDNVYIPTINSEDKLAKSFQVSKDTKPNFFFNSPIKISFSNNLLDSNYQNPISSYNSGKNFLASRIPQNYPKPAKPTNTKAHQLFQNVGFKSRNKSPYAPSFSFFHQLKNQQNLFLKTNSEIIEIFQKIFSESCIHGFTGVFLKPAYAIRFNPNFQKLSEIEQLHRNPSLTGHMAGASRCSIKGDSDILDLNLLKKKIHLDFYFIYLSRNYSSKEKIFMKNSNLKPISVLSKNFWTKLGETNKNKKLLNYFSQKNLPNLDCYFEPNFKIQVKNILSGVSFLSLVSKKFATVSLVDPIELMDSSNFTIKESNLVETKTSKNQRAWSLKFPDILKWKFQNNLTKNFLIIEKTPSNFGTLVPNLLNPNFQQKSIHRAFKISIEKRLKLSKFDRCQIQNYVKFSQNFFKHFSPKLLNVYYSFFQPDFRNNIVQTTEAKEHLDTPNISISMETIGASINRTNVEKIFKSLLSSRYIPKQKQENQLECFSDLYGAYTRIYTGASRGSNEQLKTFSLSPGSINQKEMTKKLSISNQTISKKLLESQQKTKIRNQKLVDQFIFKKPLAYAGSQSDPRIWKNLKTMTFQFKKIGFGAYPPTSSKSISSFKTRNVLKKIGFLFLSKYEIKSEKTSLQLEKYFQKKRRRKKLKLENRRRKKRKRFYPRPVWLRYSLYRKVLNARHSKNFQSFLNSSKFESIVWAQEKKLVHSKVPEARVSGFNHLNYSKSFLPPKSLKIQNYLYRNNRQKWGHFTRPIHSLEKLSFQKTILATKLPIYLTRNGFTIEKQVLNEIMPLYWKSYWLRQNLKPYLNRIRRNFNEQKSIRILKLLSELNFSNMLHSYFNFSSNVGFYPYSGGFRSKISIGPSNKMSYKKGQTGTLPFYSNKKLSFQKMNDFVFSNMHILETKRLIAEHDRILYHRISELLKNVKSNSISAKLPKIPSNKKKPNSFLNGVKSTLWKQINPEFSFFSLYGLDKVKPYGSNATLRVLWAFNKANIFSFKEKNSLRKLWETTKIEQSKSNHLKFFQNKLISFSPFGTNLTSTQMKSRNLDSITFQKYQLVQKKLTGLALAPKPAQNRITGFNLKVLETKKSKFSKFNKIEPINLFLERNQKSSNFFWWSRSWDFSMRLQTFDSKILFLSIFAFLFHLGLFRNFLQIPELRSFLKFQLGFTSKIVNLYLICLNSFYESIFSKKNQTKKSNLSNISEKLFPWILSPKSPGTWDSLVLNQSFRTWKVSSSKKSKNRFFLPIFFFNFQKIYAFNLPLNSMQQKSGRYLVFPNLEFKDNIRKAELNLSKKVENTSVGFRTRVFSKNSNYWVSSKLFLEKLFGNFFYFYSIQLSSKVSLYILEILESILCVIYRFLEKPAELMIETIAQIFFIEWMSDICTFIPETLDKNLWESFQKWSRPTKLLGFFYFHPKNASTLHSFFLSNTFKNLYFSLWESLFKPDTDLYLRQKKGIYFMTIWGDIFVSSLENYQRNTIDSIEPENLMDFDIKILEQMNPIVPRLDSKELFGSETNVSNFFGKKPAEFLRVLNSFEHGSNDFWTGLDFFGAPKKQKPIKIAQNLQKIFKEKFIGQKTYFSINQHIKISSDLFLDIAPPKSFQYVRWLDFPGSFTLGPILCEVYSGLFSKKVSKNLLLVTKKRARNSIFFIQALTGETEMKLILDNAKRYAVNFSNNKRILKDNFKSIALQTPVCYVLEDIHYIGEKRTMLIGDDQSSEDQEIYHLSRHQILQSKNSLNFHFPSTLRKQKRHPLWFSFHSGDISRVLISRLLITSEKFFITSMHQSATKSNYEDEFYVPKGAIKLKHSKKSPIKSTLPIALDKKEQKNQTIRSKIAELAESTFDHFSIGIDMITDFLVIIDSVRSYRGFVVLATTSVPSILDPALRRPGRFDETLCLPEFQFQSKSQIYPYKFPRNRIYRNIKSSLQNFDYLNLKQQLSLNLVSSLQRGTALSSSELNEYQTHNLHKTYATFSNEKIKKLQSILSKSVIYLSNYMVQLDRFKNQNFAQLGSIPGSKYSIGTSKLENFYQNCSFEQVLNHLKSLNQINSKPLSSVDMIRDLILVLISNNLGSFFYDSIPIVSIPLKNFQSLIFPYLFQKTFLIDMETSSITPTGPFSILMPAKKYEASKLVEGSFLGQNSFSIHEKINVHQKQRFLKKLYNQSVEFYFKSSNTRNKKKLATFLNSFKELGSLSIQPLKGSSTNYYYKTRFSIRHCFSLTNQWWNFQLPEHNRESTLQSDVDWRSKCFQTTLKTDQKLQTISVQFEKFPQNDQFIDFSDAEQYYSLINRKWSFLSAETISPVEVYDHLLIQLFYKTYYYFERNRELFDSFIFMLLQKGFILEFYGMEIFSRFYKK